MGGRTNLNGSSSINNEHKLGVKVNRKLTDRIDNPAKMTSLIVYNFFHSWAELNLRIYAQLHLPRRNKKGLASKTIRSFQRTNNITWYLVKDEFSAEQDHLVHLGINEKLPGPGPFCAPDVEVGKCSKVGMWQLSAQVLFQDAVQLPG
jgi:hypothetical protein